MDRALKERVIGAVVLVVFAVLIVPVFLDGPSSEAENIKQSIVLPGQDAQSGTQKTVVLERDREQPVPASRDQTSQDNPASAASEIEASSQTAEPEKFASAVPATQAATTASPAQNSPQESTTGMWAVQLGSFSNQANAERLAADLRKEGYAAFLSQLNTGSKDLHRVRVGPQKDRASAESVAAKLSAAGHKGQVVPHP